MLVISHNNDIIYYLALFSPVIMTGEILWNRIVYGKNKIVLMAFYRKLPEELQEMNAHVLTKLLEIHINSINSSSNSCIH